jgi:SAM-dependent methyltransferase
VIQIGTTRRVTACVVCASTDLIQFLDLGVTPLANKFLTEGELDSIEPAYPLRVASCGECGHVQLSEVVPPIEMFEDYLYVSSASDTLREHLYELSQLISERRRLREGDLVIDIGCNDGTLLKGFRRFGIRTLGIDPAKNLAELERESGIDRYVGLFGSVTSAEIADRYGTAALITATNTFPHIPDLHDFMRGIDRALAPGGAFVVEAHYLMDMIDQGAFDTIYHEHVSYWSLGPMIRLFEQHGFEVVEAERVPLHHGQLRVTVQRKGEGAIGDSVPQLLDAERERGLGRPETYRVFAEQTHRVKAALSRMLDDVRSQGARVAGYGAPAKGNTLLSFLELGPATIEYIVDRSPLKQGLYTPGSHIPILAVKRLLEDQPDVVILFAWNFADEILRQQAEYSRRGGRFVVPIPAPIEVDRIETQRAPAS